MGGRADLPSFDDLTPADDRAPDAAVDSTSGRRDTAPDRAAPSDRGVRPATPERGATAPPARPGPASADDWAAGDVDLDRDQIEDLLESFAKGLRAHRLYQSNNQAYQRFLSAVRDAFRRLWDRVDVLELAVEDRALRWGEHRFVVGSGHDSLAFLFYKDGIRQVTFLPGFEDEVDRFFGVLTRARTLDRQEDDLVTLLWEQDFEFFRHVYVDILAEGVEIPSPKSPSGERIDAERVAADVVDAVGSGGVAGSATAGAGAVAEVERSVSRTDFEETLYFLDDDELRRLQREVEEEWHRDVRSAVVDALFDRLEDPIPERRAEILDILQHLLVDFLTGEEYANVARVLRELGGLIERGDVLDEAERERAEAVFDAVSDPDLLGTLLDSIVEGTVDPDSEALSRLFAHLRPTTLPLLLRAIAAARRPESRVRLEEVTAGLATRYADALLDAIVSDDAALAEEAARTAGRLAIKTAVPRLRRLLNRDEPSLRRAAVEALAGLRTGDAMDALQRALDDRDREVRLTAVRGIGELGYQPARARLEAIIESRAFRATDLTEKVAFFEAYGSLGSAADIGMLDRLLNERRLFRRRAQPDVRACAALALGRLATPGAEAALERARGESHPAVRRAVARARSRAAREDEA